MPGIKLRKTLALEEVDALRTLLYFDIFFYPLTATEVFHCSSLPHVSFNEIHQALQTLLEKELIFQQGEFYQLSFKPELIEKRLTSNKRAEKYLKIAKRVSRFIGNFPFVKAVFISGSLSKGVMAKDGDIDYFIITRSGRLWLTRTMLVAFKKLFLFNSHKYFCVNYFVDTENLEIEEKNSFTATELVFLIPMYGKEAAKEFLQKNIWCRAFFPHFPHQELKNIRPSKGSFFKRLLQSMLLGTIGAQLDSWSMKKTIKHWDTKFSYMSKDEFEVALKSRKYVSKHHPNHFQAKVLGAFEEKITAFEQRTGVSLTPSE